MKEYIKHDYGASRDQSIQLLMLQHGAKAYGLYWIIVEAMYENCGTVAEAVLKNVVAMSKVRNGMSVFDTMLELGLFQVCEGGYTSKRVLVALSERNKLSEIRSNAAKVKHANAEQTESKSSAMNSNSIGIVYTPLTPQGGGVGKTTEIPTPTTEDERIEARLHVAAKRKPPFQDVLDWGETNNYKFEALCEYYDKMEACGWIEGHGRPIVNWKSHLAGAMRREASKK